MAAPRKDMIDQMSYWLQKEDATGDYEKWMSILQTARDEMHAILDRFKESGNVDLVDVPEIVDAMLDSLGCPFDVNGLTLTQKRLLVRALIGIYRQFGTDDAIKTVVATFTDRTVTDIVSPGTVDNVWELGVQVLGDGIHPLTFDVPTDFIVLSPSREFLIYSYMLDLDATPTADEEAAIARLQKIVKPAYMHYLGIRGIAPDPGIQHGELGISQLDLNWILH